MDNAALRPQVPALFRAFLDHYTSRASAAELPVLLGELAKYQAESIARLASPQRAEPVVTDRAIGSHEAAAMLNMRLDYVRRHWAKLGGRKDDDRRIKFSLADLQRRVRGQR
jgi:hypothetical protein